MKRKRFNYTFDGKLVRDKCLDIIEIEDPAAKTKHTFLNNEELKSALMKKLIEEVNEVCLTENQQDLVSEIADVLEVLEAIKKNNNISDDEVESARILKKNIRGGFEKGLFINWIEIAEGGRLYNYCLSHPEDYPISLSVKKPDSSDSE